MSKTASLALRLAFTVAFLGACSSTPAATDAGSVPGNDAGSVPGNDAGPANDDDAGSPGQDSGPADDTGTASPSIVGTWVNMPSPDPTGTYTYVFGAAGTVSYTGHTVYMGGTSIVTAGCTIDTSATGTYTSDATTLSTTFTAGMRTRTGCDNASLNGTAMLPGTFTAPDQSASYTVTDTTLTWSGVPYTRM